MKKLFMSLPFFVALVANAQTDSSLFHIGANGRLIKTDTSSTNLIIEKRVGNTVQYGFNWNGIVNGASVDPNFVSKQSQVVPNLATNVFNGTATAPPNVNGVYFNIINDNTGEVVSFKQLTTYADGTNMTDANVDGIYIRKLNGNYYRLTKERITVRDFGAKGDGITDDQTPLQNAINICSAWGMDLYVPSGTYVHSGTLNLPYTDVMSLHDPFFTIKMIGANPRTTILKYTGTGFGITAYGGSGGFCGGGFTDIYFQGTSTSTALYIAGRCGFTTHRCWFGTNAIGVLLHNPSPGTFTEYVVQYEPTFDKGCARNLEFKVGDNTTTFSNGYGYTNETVPRLIDQSFNGSGLVDATMNLDNGNNYPIKIGQGCYPYNAPLSGMYWVWQNARTIIDCESVLVPNFIGVLRHEAFNNPSTYDSVTTWANPNKIVLVGTSQTSGAVKSGSLNFAQNGFSTSGQLLGNKYFIGANNYSYNGTTVNGIDTLVGLGAINFDESQLMKVTITADLYVMQYIIRFDQQGFGQNALASIQEEIRPYAGDGISGYPVFSTLPNSLIIKIPRQDSQPNTKIYNITVNVLKIAESQNTVQ